MGGVVWWGGGGSKFFAEKAPSNGRHIYITSAPGRMVMHPAVDFSVGGSNPGGWTPAAAPLLPYRPNQRSNRLPKCLWSAALPFGHCQFCDQFSPLLGPMSATDKEPKVWVSV